MHGVPTDHLSDDDGVSTDHLSDDEVSTGHLSDDDTTDGVSLTDNDVTADCLSDDDVTDEGGFFSGIKDRAAKFWKAARNYTAEKLKSAIENILKKPLTLRKDTRPENAMVRRL